MNLDDVLLIEDAAPLLGVSPITLRRWCARGKFPNRKMPGTRRVFLSRADVQARLDGADLDIKWLADGGRLVTPKRKGGRA